MFSNPANGSTGHNDAPTQIKACRYIMSIAACAARSVSYSFLLRWSIRSSVIGSRPPRAMRGAFARLISSACFFSLSSFFLPGSSSKMEHTLHASGT